MTEPHRDFEFTSGTHGLRLLDGTFLGAMIVSAPLKRDRWRWDPALITQIEDGFEICGQDEDESDPENHSVEGFHTVDYDAAFFPATATAITLTPDLWFKMSYGATVIGYLGMNRDAQNVPTHLCWALNTFPTNGLINLQTGYLTLEKASAPAAGNYHQLPQTPR